MTSEADQDRPIRRSCFLFAVLTLLIVILLVAISLGWVGRTDHKIVNLNDTAGQLSDPSGH